MSDTPKAEGFCVGCGLGMTTVWEFCPRCGAQRVELEPEAPAVTSEPAKLSHATQMRLRVKGLIDEGKLAEAETLVRRELLRERSLEVLLVAADVLSRSLKVNDAQDLLDEALSLAPQNYLVHIRRSEHHARVGLFPQALEEITRARRFLPPADVTALAYCQELQRVFRDRAQGNFVRGSSAPRFASRFSGLRKRAVAPSHEALYLGPEVR